MQIILNQHVTPVGPTDTLLDALEQYCEEHRLSVEHIAVTQTLPTTNKAEGATMTTLLPRSSWATCPLTDGQSFSLFTAVAGG